MTYLNGQKNQNLTFLWKDIINKFRSHYSIIKLKQTFPFKIKFGFKPATEAFVKNIVSDLSKNKAASGDIPLNVLKESTFIFSEPCMLRQWSSSIVNEGISVILNLFILFFFTRRFHTHKKHRKHKKHKT